MPVGKADADEVAARTTSRLPITAVNGERLTWLDTSEVFDEPVISTLASSYIL
jgi:hypothetical protein